MKQIAASICLMLLTVPVVKAADPDPTKGRVLVYQNIRSIPNDPLFCDGMKVASLRHKTYFVLELPPGEHSFRGKRKADEVIVDIVAGHDYFLEFGLGELFNRFARRTAEEGQLTIAMIANGQLHPIETKDMYDPTRVSLTFAPRPKHEEK